MIVKHSLFKLIQFIVLPPCCLGLVLFLELINTNSNLTLLTPSRANINLYRFVQMCGPKREKGLVYYFFYEIKLENKTLKYTDGQMETHTQVYRSYHVNTVYVPSSKVYPNLRIAAIICHWYIVNNTSWQVVLLLYWRRCPIACYTWDRRALQVLHVCVITHAWSSATWSTWHFFSHRISSKPWK